MKLLAAYSSETPVSKYKNTKRYNPEDWIWTITATETCLCFSKRSVISLWSQFQNYTTHCFEIEPDTMHVQSNIEAPSCTYFCSGKAISITCCECECVCMCVYVCVCVCVCVWPYLSWMQYACAILSSVDCSAPTYFSTSSHKRKDLRKKLLNINAYFHFSYNFCLKHFSF